MNAVNRTILTDRIYPQLFIPERSKGISIGKGEGDGWYGKGLFGDRIGYWFGAFNGSNDRRNVNTDLMYAGRIVFTPFGSLTGDEYNVRFSPFKVQLTGGAATSRDTNTAVTGSATAKVKDNWYASGLEVEARGWFLMAEWSKKTIDAGNVTAKRETNAYFVGATRTFAMPFKDQFFGVGFGWQKINNEDPGTTSQFGPRSATASGLSFDKGTSYHPVVNYMFMPDVRLQVEYAMYREDGVKIKNDTLFSRLSFAF